jgi:hypothetical protein
LGQQILFLAKKLFLTSFNPIDKLTAQNGNLNDKAKIEFLFSIGDLLYNFIQKYIEIITFADQKKLKIDDFHETGTVPYTGGSRLNPEVVVKTGEKTLTPASAPAKSRR